MIRSAGSSKTVVEPLDVVLGDEREANDRPWVMVNMISSLDGGTSVDGKSSGLGDEDDFAMFQAFRTVPDVILVGASTVTAEDYSPVSLDPARRARRAEMGRAEAPTLAIVSGRLSIDPEAKVFSDPDSKPLIITGTEADPSKLMMLGDAADVVILQQLDPPTILGQLGAAQTVLLEGGPSLNGQFAAAGLIDEVNLSLAPVLIAGGSSRITRGAELKFPQRMLVDRVLYGDRLMFIRYVRTGAEA
jgi:riboflavin biosynthesis pyrimidine reductase